jgi:hypothetical protein
MNNNPKTERAEYVFAAKEHIDGQAFIALEPSNGDLSILKDGVLFFDLPKGTDVKRASKIAEQLQDLIPSIAYTK